MKRIITSLVAFAIIASAAYAIPAKPGFRTYTQPDGRTLVLEQKGDEFGSWFRDKAGNRYIMDGKGYFLPVTDVRVRKMSRNASLKRTRANNLRTSDYTDMTHGTRRIPVVLVEFSDVKFKINSPAQNFDALLNEQGYNGYNGVGATGSVRDFYLDNSHGAFEPVFDVFGPVSLDNPIKYYGEQIKNSDGTVDQQDKQPELALYDACLKLDDTVDFSLYDYNSDGLVDMVLFYYAGGSQAEGWPVDHIWPHSWSVQGSSSSDARSHKFDGKKLGNYFCSSELKGLGVSETMCSIGVTCHEFAHSLGLPDFYDADYDENGSNEGLYSFSTMCMGSYNDFSRTPPFFNAEERIMLGWMEESDIKMIKAGENVLPFIDNNVAFKTLATAEGEYFLYEKRGGEGSKWDAPLHEGMVVYHVDKSPSHTIVGSISAQFIWRTNTINNYGGHPCFYVVAPSDQESTSYESTKLDCSDLVFPGFYGIDSYCARDWDGNYSSYILSDIHVSGNEVHFTATPDSDSRFLDGTVTDTSGKPLEGVSVALNPYTEAAPSTSGIVIRKLLSAGGQETFTDPTGRFSFEIAPDAPENYSLSASLDGYVGQSVTVRINKKVTTTDFTLRAIGEFGMTGDFPFWDIMEKDIETMEFYAVGSIDDKSMMIGEQCSRDIWGAYEGLLVKSVNYFTYYDAEAYYFILDSNDGLTAVKSPNVNPQSYAIYDISDKGIHIPSGDFYLGVAVENVKSNKENSLIAVPSGGGCFSAPLNLQGHGDWKFLGKYDVPIIVTLSDEDYIPGLPDIGQPYIDIAPGAYRAGDKVELKIASSPDLKIKSIAWTFDGAETPDGCLITLTAGWHTVSAEVTYLDNTRDILEREIEVK